MILEVITLTVLGYVVVRIEMLHKNMAAETPVINQLDISYDSKEERQATPAESIVWDDEAMYEDEQRELLRKRGEAADKRYSGLPYDEEE